MFIVSMLVGCGGRPSTAPHMAKQDCEPNCVRAAKPDCETGSCADAAKHDCETTGCPGVARRDCENNNCDKPSSEPVNATTCDNPPCKNALTETFMSTDPKPCDPGVDCKAAKPCDTPDCNGAKADPKPCDSDPCR